LRKRALAERTKSNTLLSRAKCQVQNKYPFTLLPIYQLPTASGKLKIGKSLQKENKSDKSQNAKPALTPGLQGNRAAEKAIEK